MKKIKTINVRVNRTQFEKLMNTVIKREKSKSAIIQELLDNLNIHNTTISKPLKR
jgi:hypothetical protein